MSNDLDMSEFQDIFFEECAEGLDVMEKGLMGLDDGADSEFINTIFRAAHSIKGGGGTFGFTAITEFTHSVETILGEFREGTRSVTRPVVDLLLTACDILRHMTGAMQEGEPVDTNRVAEVQAQLEAVLAGGSGELGPEAAAESAPESDSTSSDMDISSGGESVLLVGWAGELLGVTEDELLGHINKIAGVSASEPVRSGDGDELHTIGIRVSGSMTEDALKEGLAWVPSEITFTVADSSPPAPAPQMPKPMFFTNIDFGDEDDAPAAKPADPAPEAAPKAAAPVPASASVATEPAPAAPAAVTPTADDAGGAKPPAPPAGGGTGGSGSGSGKSGQANTIRVNIEKVDEIINLVGELVITQSILSQCCAKLDYMGEELRTGLDQLERHTRDLQDSVMKIRMLPISFVFNRFPRMVRDISSKLGKEIELEVIGEATELDKTVLENISDPLVHLVRNSVDHGIEMPKDRDSVGKDRTGRVILEAYHEGGNVVIQIRDDGKGLDRARIRAKAIQKGLISEEETLSDERIYDLIFHPGFSTADVVSDLSGRGVGMDVVKRNIRDLSGTIEVSSSEGEGTTFTIRLPLTLAIIDGQLARIGSETYVVPVLSVIESNQMKASQVSSIANGTEVYRFREEYIPIIRISEIFGLSQERRSIEEGLLIVVDAEGMKAGLHVDELLGQQQVVIKGMETNYKPIPGISGATILGDGRVAMILDIAGIINNSNWVDSAAINKAIERKQLQDQSRSAA
ncbi:MAG: chemotaxis protein CheA [Gammaproteobacteria bacterium]|nr:chemotaxis protein CheA [Gammaproteobacteria bacterium]